MCADVLWEAAFEVTLMFRNKAEDVATQGEVALADMANDIDFVMLLRHVGCVG